MRCPSIHPSFFRLIKGSQLGLSHLFFAAALSSSFFALRPALASEEGDGSLFRVPGEGPPYVPYYAPRADWPPMPDRSPFFERHRYSGREPEIAHEHGKSYNDHDAVAAPYPHRDETYDDAERARLERHDEGHGDGYAAHDRDRSDVSHDEEVASGPYAEDRQYGVSGNGEGFGRLFPPARSHDENDALKALGRAMVEDGEPGDPAGDSVTPAGYTYLAQFIDHDITFDASTQLGRPLRGDYQLVNARTPDLDLDNVYGLGPARTPHLYRLPYIRVGRLISAEGEPPRSDLFRTKASQYYGPAGGEAVALLGDPRNDENIVISQLHAAFIAFHNRTADILIERDYGRDRWSYCRAGSRCDTQELAEALPDHAKLKVFEAAHDHTVYYYHRLIAEDFLPRIIGADYAAAFLKHGRAFYFPNGFRDSEGHIRKPYIPVEFSGAAYRFGHSQVRDAYQLREGAAFDLFSEERGGPRAFQPVTPRFLLDWRYFFDIGHHRPENFNYGRKIDTELVRGLHRLNFTNAVGRLELGSLAARNLVRGQMLHLPSGQSLAERILPVLQERGLIGQGGYGPRAGGHGEGWRAYLLRPDDRVRYFLGNANSPLWYYILQEAGTFGTRPYAEPDNGEAEAVSDDYRPYRDRASFHNASLRYGEGHGRHHYGNEGGDKLGPVGATIVGEVLSGLLEHYREETGKGLAYEPQIRSGSDRPYTMSDFLVDAGVADRH